MPTILTHAIVPLACAAAAGRGVVSPKLAVAGAVLAMAPDADVIGFALGVDYGATWGHRGATHSIAFAFMVGAALSLVWREARSLVGFLFLSFSMASHGILDTLTSGGLGAALWWPFEATRHFAPFTPVRVSPIGMDFFTGRGLVTLKSEFKWIGMPCLALVVTGMGLRRVLRQPKP